MSQRTGWVLTLTEGGSSDLTEEAFFKEERKKNTSQKKFAVINKHRSRRVERESNPEINLVICSVSLGRHTRAVTQGKYASCIRPAQNHSPMTLFGEPDTRFSVPEAGTRCYRYCCSTKSGGVGSSQGRKGSQVRRHIVLRKTGAHLQHASTSLTVHVQHHTLSPANWSGLWCPRTAITPPCLVFSLTYVEMPQTRCQGLTR